jgi:N-acetylglucosaminyl-diphospho-decaprenol L-rhamnosyltransferase
MGASVTVAVVSWNTRELLGECLRSLEADVRGERAAVWVVDNASSDGSAELVRDEMTWATLIASDENLGFGRAINLVARRTTTPWLAVANADVAVEPGALETLLAAADRDWAAGAIAPRLVLPNGRTQHSVYSFPTVPYALALNLALPRVVPGLGDRLAIIGHWNADRPRRVPWAIGAFLLVRREAWDAAGGFDERQWMYAEDLDLGWRLHLAGWHTRYEPRAIVRHHGAASTAQAWGDDRLARTQRSAYGWMLTRRGRMRTWVIGAINVSGLLARSMVWAHAARRDPARFGHRRAAAGWWMRVHAKGLAGATSVSASSGPEGGPVIQ